MSIWSSFVGGLLHQSLKQQVTAINTKQPSATKKAADIIDTLFTSDEERLDKQAVLARIALQSDTLQTLPTIRAIMLLASSLEGMRKAIPLNPLRKL